MSLNRFSLTALPGLAIVLAPVSTDQLSRLEAVS